MDVYRKLLLRLGGCMGKSMKVFENLTHAQWRLASGVSEVSTDSLILTER